MMVMKIARAIGEELYWLVVGTLIWIPRVFLMLIVFFVISLPWTFLPLAYEIGKLFE